MDTLLCQIEVLLYKCLISSGGERRIPNEYRKEVQGSNSGDYNISSTPMKVK